jgi:hypothetical protein
MLRVSWFFSCIMIEGEGIGLRHALHSANAANRMDVTWRWSSAAPPPLQQPRVFVCVCGWGTALRALRGGCLFMINFSGLLLPV